MIRKGKEGSGAAVGDSADLESLSHRHSKLLAPVYMKGVLAHLLTDGASLADLGLEQSVREDDPARLGADFDFHSPCRVGSERQQTVVRLRLCRPDLERESVKGLAAERNRLVQE